MPEKSEKTRPWWSRGTTISISIGLFLAAGGLAIFVVPGMLLRNWLPDPSDAQTANRLLGVAAQVVLFTLGGVIALVGVGVSLSRHGQETVAAERDRELARLQQEAHQLDRDKESQRRAEHELERAADTERALRARFLAAVDLLGQAQTPIKRTAGLYAIAGLADDWHQFGRPDERQVCIDVLCGYLRAPVEDEGTPPAEIEVRRTGYSLICAHLQDAAGDGPQWAGATIDLNGATIDFNLDLSNITVSGHTVLDFNGATVRHARLRFAGPQMRDRGRLNLVQLEALDGSIVDFSHARAADDAAIDLTSARLADSSCLIVRGSGFEGDSFLSLDGLRADDLSQINIQTLQVEDLSRIRMDGELTGRSNLVVEDVFVQDDGRVELVPYIEPGTRLTIRRLEKAGNARLLLADELTQAAE